MFLNYREISERLRSNALVVEPFIEQQIGPCSLDIRLGTEFRELPEAGQPLDTAQGAGQPVDSLREFRCYSAALGDRVVLQPHSRILGVSLETISLPLDLFGFVIPRSSYQRFGLSTGGLTAVHPGWAGRLVLALDNMSDTPIAVHAGAIIATIAFAVINPIEMQAFSYRELWPAIDTAPESQVADVEPKAKALTERMKETQRAEEIGRLVSRALEAEGADKGKELQVLANAFFKMIRGLRILKTEARLAAEEIDLVVQNNLDVGFWRYLGSPMTVGCKNWSRRVRARDISVMAANLESMTPDAQTGILIAPNGSSGDQRRDAQLKIREIRQRGRYLLVIERQDLEDVAAKIHPAEIIDRAYSRLMLL